MTDGRAIPVIGTFFRLKHIKNPGAAFGILIGNRHIFLAISILAIIIIFIYYFHLSKQHKGSTVALGLIMGGALGNLLDRLVYGEVTDFLEFYFGTIVLFGRKISLHWPIFNVADMGVSIGVGLLIFIMLIEEYRLQKTKKESDALDEMDKPTTYSTGETNSQ